MRERRLAYKVVRLLSFSMLFFTSGLVWAIWFAAAALGGEMSDIWITSGTICLVNFFGVTGCNMVLRRSRRRFADIPKYLSGHKYPDFRAELANQLKYAFRRPTDEEHDKWTALPLLPLIAVAAVSLSLVAITVLLVALYITAFALTDRYVVDPFVLIYGPAGFWVISLLLSTRPSYGLLQKLAIQKA